MRFTFVTIVSAAAVSAVCGSIHGQTVGPHLIVQCPMMQLTWDMCSVLFMSRFPEMRSLCVILTLPDADCCADGLIIYQETVSVTQRVPIE